MKENIDPRKLVGSVLRDNATGEEYEVLTVEGAEVEPMYAWVRLRNLQNGLIYSNYYSNLELEIKHQEETTDGKYLAPNGKPSNLTPEMWEYVRTPQFKAWFGDWELPLKQVEVHHVPRHDFTGSGNEAIRQSRLWASKNLIRTYTNSETGGKGEILISEKAVRKYLAQDCIDESENLGVHLAALKELPALIKKSIDVETHPDYNKVGDHRDPDYGINKDVMIHRLYGAAEIEKEIYRIKITLKEYLTQSLPSKPHSYEISKISLFQEKKRKELNVAPMNGSEKSNAIQIGGNDNTNSISAAKLLKNIEKSYKKGEKILDYSKILDENGEPMVLYHGTDRFFDEFMGTKRGIWFADSDSRAKGYAAAKGGDIVIPVFLNIRKPAYSEYPNSEKDDWRRFSELGYDGRIVDDNGHIFNAVALNDSQVLRVGKALEEIRKEKDALTTVIKERITDSSAREFTPRQKGLIVSYLQDHANYGLEGLERIYETACKDDAVKACCKEWKEQAWEDIVEIYGHPEKFEEILAEASKDAGYKGPKY